MGKSIIRFGERKVLSLEYLSVIFIFTAYATTDSKLLVAFIYILDQIFFTFAIAIRTYFQKVGDPQDIAPSMAVGFTINHLAAVFLPAIGGMLWVVDYRIPFFAGAAMGVISLLAVQKIENAPKLKARRKTSIAIRHALALRGAAPHCLHFPGLPSRRVFERLAGVAFQARQVKLITLDGPVDSKRQDAGCFNEEDFVGWDTEQECNSESRNGEQDHRDRDCSVGAPERCSIVVDGEIFETLFCTKPYDDCQEAQTEERRPCNGRAMTARWPTL